MTRIVAGAARGRRLRVPAGSVTRPTSDRVREALFSTLESMLGGFDGLRVLDLYAGSGALGLEALSRGASLVTLVESDARAAQVIRANVDAADLPGARVIEARVERALARPRGSDASASVDTPYHLVLADPPYDVGSERVARVLSGLTTGWLAPDGVVVVERDRRSEPVHWPDGLMRLQERAYGETVLWYGRSAGAD